MRQLNLFMTMIDLYPIPFSTGRHLRWDRDRSLVKNVPRGFKLIYSHFLIKREGTKGFKECPSHECQLITTSTICSDWFLLIPYWRERRILQEFSLPCIASYATNALCWSHEMPFWCNASLIPLANMFTTNENSSSRLLDACEALQHQYNLRPNISLTHVFSTTHDRFSNQAL